MYSFLLFALKKDYVNMHAYAWTFPKEVAEVKQISMCSHGIIFCSVWMVQLLWVSSVYTSIFEVRGRQEQRSSGKKAEQVLLLAEGWVGSRFLRRELAFSTWMAADCRDRGWVTTMTKVHNLPKASFADMFKNNLSLRKAPKGLQEGNLGRTDKHS